MDSHLFSPQKVRNRAHIYRHFNDEKTALTLEAIADRLEELETALDIIAGNNGVHLKWQSTAPMPMERYRDNCNEMMEIARVALKGKKVDAGV